MSRSNKLIHAIFRWVFLAAMVPPGFAQEKNSAAPVSFSRDIAPVLAKKCVVCHGPDKSKGGYHLHTYGQLLRPGSSKSPSITPGRPDESELFRLITVTDPDDRMPQKDDPLSAEQIALIERWIKEGARFDGADPKAELATLFQHRPSAGPPEIYPHPIPVLAVAFSPDGKELAVGGYHEVTFWDPADGKLRRRLPAVAQRIENLAYSPDGSRLAAVGGVPGQYGEIRLFDLANDSTSRELGKISDTLLTVCFSPDGARVAAGGADNAIRVYNVASGKQELLIEQHADWVMGLAFSHDGRTLASASRDKSARLFDSRTGGMLESYLDHGEPVHAVAFSADDKSVYSAGRDKAIHIWSASSAKKSVQITGFDGDILRLIVENGRVFSCSTDTKVREHDAASRELLRTYAGHADEVYALACDPSRARLATGSYDGQVRIWNTSNGQSITVFTAAPGYKGTNQTSRRQAECQ